MAMNEREATRLASNIEPCVSSAAIIKLPWFGQSQKTLETN